MEKQKTGHSEPDLRDVFNVTEDELDDTLQEYLENIEEQTEKKKKKSYINFPTVAGGVMLLTTFLYFMQSLGLFGGPDLGNFLNIFPVIGVILVALIGFGLLSRNRGKKKRKKTSKKGKSAASAAIYNDTGYDAYGLKVQKRLMRSITDKKLFGVCGGIAKYFGLDPTLVRIIFAIAIFFYGVPLVIYFLMAIFMPKEPKMI
ncbi:MAG: PspC domain-containing protein [Cyclonatronaceae bacterium]